MSTVSGSLTLSFAPAKPDRARLLVNLMLIAVAAITLFDSYLLLIALR